MKQNKRPGGDPYYYWKIVNMILACVILILAVLIILGGKEGLLVPGAFFLGIIMCTLSGIIELAKNKKVLGYICSVFAGALTVALIISVMLQW